MAKIYNVNQPCNYGGTSAMFSLKETLKATGKWRVSASSDGTTLFSNSDGLTHSGSGAGGLNNGLAWFHMVDINDKVNWIFQRGANPGFDPSSKYRIKFLASGNYALDGFPGTITATPRHVSEDVLWNFTTNNGNPIFQHAFYGPSGSSGGDMYSHTIAMDVEENGIYPFWHMAVTRSVNTCGTILGMEPLLSGTYIEQDPAPYVIYCKHTAQGITFNDWANVNTTVGSSTNTEISTYNPIFGHILPDLSNSLRPLLFLGAILPTNYIATNFTSSLNGNDYLYPITVGKYATQPTIRKAFNSSSHDVTNSIPIIKGTLKYTKSVVNPIRIPGTTYFLNSPSSALFVFGATAQAVAMPWPEGVTPFLV